MKEVLRISAATSTKRATLDAAEEATTRVGNDLGEREPDLVLVFASRHHEEKLEPALSGVNSVLRARNLAGCSAEGIIGGAVEFEEQPAFSVWAAVIPGSRITLAHLQFAQTPDGFAFIGIPEMPPLSESQAPPASMLLLGDPFTFPADAFLTRASQDHPGLRILGGMASGASSPGESCLFRGEPRTGVEIYREGAVAVLLSGGLRLEPVVSQGCKPFGRPLVVTKADEYAIFELGGRPALEKLKEQLAELSGEEQALVASGLHLGIAIDAHKSEHKRGDFLVRNVVGIHQNRRGIVVADWVRPGHTVQFHLRDAESASEDLRLLLRAASLERPEGKEPAGGLLFSCNGRGERLFGAPNHDAQAVREEIGEIPLAGFFAAGEIGPVGGRNFLHGFTASLAFFYPP